MIEIDGSFGEGGGQILRTSLSLSCLLGKPFRIRKIRQGRARPGLMPQHLVAVRAAQCIARAEVDGDTRGSAELSFSPKRAAAGEFTFDIGTAGSISLVLQTIIPPLLFSSGKSRVTLLGGTHVPFSPPFHYLAEIFTPFLRRLGYEVRLDIDAYGFYPRGGGRVRAEIWPAGKGTPLLAAERGKLVRVEGLSAVGNLPLSIAERQKSACLNAIHGAIPSLRNTVRIDPSQVPGPGQGTFVFLRAESEKSLAGFTSLGARGKRGETVGEEAGREFIAYLDTGAALDPHLADQIVLYLSLCEGGSLFTTSCITRHLLTNLRVIGFFHEFSYAVDGEPGGPGTVRINCPDSNDPRPNLHGPSRGGDSISTISHSSAIRSWRRI